MNAPALLDELHNLGVTVEARGDRVRFKPVNALPPELLAVLRSQKREILTLLKGKRQTEDEIRSTNQPPPEITPYQRLEFDWQAAVTRAREGFEKNATRPSHECLEAAAAIELGLADATLPRQGATANNVREFLEEIYAGRSVASLTASGRIVLRSVPRGRGIN
jgi:hypothetical protein